MNISYTRYLADTSIVTEQDTGSIDFRSLKIITPREAHAIAIKRSAIFNKDISTIRLVYYERSGKFEWHLSATDVRPVKYRWYRGRNYIVRTRQIIITGGGKISRLYRQRSVAYSVRF